MPGTIGDASSWHEAQSMSPNFSRKLLNWMTEPSLPSETPESHLHLQRGYAGEFIGLDQDGRPVLAFEEEDVIDASSSGGGSTQQDTQGKAGDQRFIAVVHSSDPASISFSNEFHSGLAVGAQSYFYQQRQGGQQERKVFEGDDFLINIHIRGTRSASTVWVQGKRANEVNTRLLAARGA